MTISAQLKVIEERLKGLTAAVEIEGSVEGLFGRFAEGAPAGVRAVVMFIGEEGREPLEGGMVDRQFLVVTSVGRGMAMPGDATRATAGTKPIYEVVEETRQLLRGLQFDAETTEVTPDYKSNGIFTMPDGRPVNAMQHTLSIGVQLAAP